MMAALGSEEEEGPKAMLLCMESMFVNSCGGEAEGYRISCGTWNPTWSCSRVLGS